MKVFIMTDLEGVSGINGSGDSVGNKVVEDETACRLLMEEVNATVEGLVDAGAKEIVVVDGHGGGKCIQVERLHPSALLHQIGGGLSPVTCGVDGSYDASVHIGTHAMIGVGDGFLNHTFNSHAVANMWLNDTSVGEIAVEALVSAYFGVPTILVSGDRAACREAREFLGDVETVETKTALGRYSVINRNPVQVREELRRKAQAALKKKESFALKKINPPYRLKIQLMCPNMADACQQRGARRLDHQTILFESDDFVDVWAQRNAWAKGVHNKLFNI